MSGNVAVRHGMQIGRDGAAFIWSPFSATDCQMYVSFLHRHDWVFTSFPGEKGNTPELH